MHDYEKLETIRQIIEEVLAQKPPRLKEALKLTNELLAKYIELDEAKELIKQFHKYGRIMDKDPNQEALRLANEILASESVKGDR